MHTHIHIYTCECSRTHTQKCMHAKAKEKCSDTREPEIRTGSAGIGRAFIRGDSHGNNEESPQMAGLEQITGNKEVVSRLFLVSPLPPGKGVATRLCYGYNLD